MPYKRSKYEEQFKLDLIQRVLAGGKSASDVSAASGVEVSVLYGWIRKYRLSTDATQFFPGNGKLTNHNDELRRFRRRVAQLEEERSISKKP